MGGEGRRVSSFGGSFASLSHSHRIKSLSHRSSTRSGEPTMTVQRAYSQALPLIVCGGHGGHNGGESDGTNHDWVYRGFGKKRTTFRTCVSDQFKYLVSDNAHPRLRATLSQRFLPGFSMWAKDRVKCDTNVAGALSDPAVEGGHCVAHQIHIDPDMGDINQLVWDPLGAAGCA